MNRLLLFAGLLTLAALACGGGSKDLSDCVEVTVDAVSPGLSIVDVYGTARNACSQGVGSAKVVATCYNSSGAVIARDEEYVENLDVGESKTFDAIISDPNQQTTRCSAAVEEAR
jgi:hypothetical protein